MKLRKVPASENLRVILLVSFKKLLSLKILEQTNLRTKNLDLKIDLIFLACFWYRLDRYCEDIRSDRYQTVKCQKTRSVTGMYKDYIRTEYLHFRYPPYGPSKIFDKNKFETSKFK